MLGFWANSLRTLSAGGQEEQLCEVKSSTTTIFLGNFSARSAFVPVKIKRPKTLPIKKYFIIVIYSYRKTRWFQKRA